LESTFFYIYGYKKYTTFLVGPTPIHLECAITNINHTTILPKHIY